MNNALYIAATGMQAQQLNVDTIANNLANLNTSSYKAARVSFRDLMAGQPPRAADGAGGAPGLGVSGTVAIRNFEAGEVKASDSPFDLAIRGRGFFEVNLADGTRAYLRGGRLGAGKNGLLALAGGRELSKGLPLPPDLAELVIGADGSVMARGAGEAQAHEIGRLDLVDFVDPGALRPLGDGLYLATEGAGEALPGRAGEDGFGTLVQGHVEVSNVKMADEMVSLMLAQRAYQLNSKMIETADEMMAMTNNLRRA